jgi:response regulator RpfG family c-di-GMP phosphodiesterase
MKLNEFINSETDMIIQNLISVWVDLLDARNLESKPHNERVTKLTVQFGKKLGLSSEMIKTLYFGAQLHDIGNLGVQDAVLLKKEKLTDEEYESVKNHPIVALKMMEDSPYLAPFIDIPASHHERWDGKGYPRGLKQDEIPLVARIYAIVDSWDALTNERPFRKAMPKEEAIITLKQNRGVQFDPSLLDKFLSMLEEKETALEGKELILIVDDEPYLRLALKDYFTTEGFDCRVAASGKEAMMLLETITPSLIISDIMMPSMNGFDFRKSLQLISDELGEIPFIFLSAKTSSQDKTEGYGLTIDDYVTKPFEPQELLLKVKAILRRSRLSRKKEEDSFTREKEHLTHVITRNTTHELKSPLGIIIGNLEVVMRKFNNSTDPIIAPCLADAQTSAKRLQGVIDQLLYLYKIDNKILSDQMAEIDPDKNVNSLIQDAAVNWSSKELHLKINIANDLQFMAPIDGFSYTLTQLIDNACKFANQGGEVDVSLFKEDGNIVLIVENSGERIPVFLREKVFERFFQVSDGDNRDSSGLGLGLAIAKNFAESCGGRIDILDSRIGSKVRLQIPYIPTEPTYSSPIALASELRQ